MSTNWKDRYLRSRYMVQKTIREYNEKPSLKAYVEIFLTLTAISLFGLFAIRPTLTTIGKLLQEIEAKKSTLTTMNEKIRNLKTAQDLFTRESEKIKLVREAIPEFPNPDNLILQIEELAKTKNVTIDSMSIEDTKIIGELPPNDDGILTLSLYVVGEYQDLIMFASEIEDLRRPVKYNGLTINMANSSDGKLLFMSIKDPSTPYITKDKI